MPTPNAVTTVSSRGVGTVFADTINELVSSVPSNVTSAIDLQIEFRSVHVDEKGVLGVLFGGQKGEETTTIRLSTRIFVGDSNA